MEASEAPEEIYLLPDSRNPNHLSFCWYKAPYRTGAVEYIRADVFIEKACQWLNSNITNSPNANSILVRNGCVTLGMLIEDFKKYMKGG